VTVKDIKERRVPELNDEFAKTIGEKSDEKFETVQELREKIRIAMEQAASDLADRQVESSIVEKLVEDSKISFPDAMLEHEVSHRLQDLTSELKSKKMNLDEYLDARQLTFEQLNENIEKSVERDIRTSLVLDEVAERENIEASDEEVETEASRMAEESRLPIESMTAYLDKTNGRETIRYRLVRRKVLEFLLHASNIKNVGRTASRKE
jgi:trigger factor